MSLYNATAFECSQSCGIENGVDVGFDSEDYILRKLVLRDDLDHGPPVNDHIMQSVRLS